MTNHLAELPKINYKDRFYQSLGVLGLLVETSSSGLFTSRFLQEGFNHSFPSDYTKQIRTTGFY